MRDETRISRFVDEFGSESDRGCAVLVLCVLEDALIEAIKKRLPECDSDALRQIAPYGRLSASVSNAYLIGVISHGERDELTRLIKIRNKFAHKALEGLSFDHPDIADMCSKLTLSNLFSELPFNSSRGKFVMSALVLHTVLQEASTNIVRIEVEKEKNFVLSPKAESAN